MLPNYPYTLSFKSSTSLQQEGQDLFLILANRNKLRIANPGKAIEILLENLFSGGMTDDELCQASMQAGSVDAAKIYFLLNKLSDCGVLSYTLKVQGKDFATLHVNATPFELREFESEAAYKLSRFAYLRNCKSKMIIESPLSKASLSLESPLALSAISYLSSGCTVQELSQYTGMEAAQAAAFLRLLFSAGMLCASGTESSSDCDHEEESLPLRLWEFHDLLFHARSRLGRHDYGFGPTSRFLDIVPPLPAVKAPMSEKRIKLYEPDQNTLRSDPLYSSSFFDVVEKRRSIRRCDGEALSVESLGAFLHFVARIRQLYPSAPEQIYEISLRPCPSAGAMHELELYLSITNCRGLEAGFYHYAPDTHELEYLSELSEPVKSMLEDARFCSYMDLPPQVLINLAARFQRIAWQYESMAYAAMLRDAGVMIQQMYLVATALGLAPCALGRANSDTFAQATGLDYYVENSIADFMLSGKKV